MAPAPPWAPYQQLAGTPMTAGQRRHLALLLDAALTPKAAAPPSLPLQPAPSSVLTAVVLRMTQCCWGLRCMVFSAFSH